MAIRIIIDIFSGLENPVIEIDGKAATITLERLKPTRKLALEGITPILPFPTLGYRGLIVEQVGARASRLLPKAFRLEAGQLSGPKLAHVPADENFENFFFSRKGLLQRLKAGRNLLKFIREEVERSRQVRAKLVARLTKLSKKKAVTKAATKEVASGCSCAPIFEPNWWNDGGLKQLNNNCYNYSTNYRTDTFAQPGRAAGIIITPPTSLCSIVKPAAELDDIIDAPTANNQCPQTGHLVALVMASGFDFHWYRKGPNGLWTHKVGPAPVTNLDNSGNLISDPRTADRGPYTDFCGFMVVMHGHIKLI